MTISRFDIPKSVNHLLTTAVRFDIIDVIEVYALATEFNGNWWGLAERICEYAFMGPHHKPIAMAADLVWRDLGAFKAYAAKQL